MKKQTRQCDRAAAVPGLERGDEAQRWMIIITPAMSASDAMITPMPLNLRPNRETSPVTTNQMPARNTPMPFK
jgi:hypothetical protein